MDNLLQQLGITPLLLLTQIIGFGILYLLLRRFAFGPLFGILDDRRSSIEATYAQLDRDKAAMEAARLEYQQRLDNIEAEAREKIGAAVKEAQTLRDNLMADAQKQAETIVERGRQESDRERQKAFLEMRQQIVALAVAAAGRVVGESLNEARHTKMVDDFITEVGTGAITSSGRGMSGNTIGNNGTHGGGAVTL